MLYLLMKLFYEVFYIGVISSALVILILLMKRCFTRVFRPKWHYYIWLLLVIRLMVPFTFQSPLSIQNLFPITEEQLIRLQQDNIWIDGTSGQADSVTEVNSQISADSKPVHNSKAMNTLTPEANTGKTPKPLKMDNRMTLTDRSLPILLMLLWLSGMAVILLYTIVINIAFVLTVKREYVPLNNPRILAVLEECKNITGIKDNIRLFTASLNRSPSLYASFHAKILVSEAQLEQLSDQEIKYVFLHELSHYKRKDILVNWVITLLQIVYFFQPLIWIAFRIMREDCEISCDAEALRYLKQEEHLYYGRTLIKLLKLLTETKSNFLPATAGLGSRKANYRRRVLMISNYKKAKLPNTIITILLMLLVGLVGMTGCQKSSKETNNTKTEAADETNDTKAAEPTIAVPSSTGASSAEPSAVPTSEPAPTIAEVPDQGKAVNVEYLCTLIGLSQEELVTKLGEDYTKVDEGGLEFTKPGFRVWFDENNRVSQIWTNNTDIDFGGVKVGDGIDRFETALGKPAGEGEVSKFFQVDHDYLEVYYDNDKVFAVYLLSEEATMLQFKEKISSVKPTPSDDTPILQTD